MNPIRTRTLSALLGAFCFGITALPAAQSGALNTTTRWEDADAGLLWIGTDVAIGDFGSTVISAKELNHPKITVASGIDATPSFEHVIPHARQIRVDAARKASSLAAMVQFYDLPSAPKQFQPELWVWKDALDAEPAWKYTFPIAQYSYLGGMDVHLSDDGQRVIAWNSYFVGKRVDIRVFDLDGVLLGSFEATRSYNSTAGGDATITEDGKRMLIDIGNHPQLIDLQTGELIFEWPHHNLFAGHGMSGDGRTVAIGDDNKVEVWRQAPNGKFAPVWSHAFAGNRTTSFAELDGDGSHLAVLIDSYNPAETLDLMVFDLIQETEVASHRFFAPNNWNDVIASGLEMTEDATMIVGSTWGDFLGDMPDAFAYSLADGLTAEVYTQGSANACDMDPSGQVMAVATKAVHVNTPGAGGSIICADTQAAALRVTGVPRAGATVTVAMHHFGNAGWLVAAAALGSDATPWGECQLDLSTTYDMARIPLRNGEAQFDYRLPAASAAIGRAIHLQAAFSGEGGSRDQLSNRVSFQILP